MSQDNAQSTLAVLKRKLKKAKRQLLSKQKSLEKINNELHEAERLHEQLEKEWGKVTTILADTLSGLEVGVSSETKSEFNALE